MNPITQELTNQFLLQLKEKEYAKDTIKQYRGVLKKISAISLDKAGLDAYQTSLLNIKPQSRHRYLLVTKIILQKFAPELAKNIIIPKLPKILPQNIPSQTSIKEILQKPDVSTFKGIRDKAMLELFYSTGIRRMELVQLKIEDVDLSHGLLRVNQGKMKKDRILPMNTPSVQWLRKYLAIIRPALNPRCNSLFLSRFGYQMHEGTPHKIITKYAPQSPHKYRHSFATHLLQNGMKETSLQRLLGHAQVSTTQIYTQVTIKDLRKSYEKYHRRDLWKC